MKLDSSEICMRPGIQPSDLDDVVRIVELAFDGRWSTEECQLFLSSSKTSCHIAEYNGVAAGFLMLQHYPDHLYIALIATDPRFQHRGIGSAMLAWLREHLAEFGSKSIKLHCRATAKNPNRFYLTNGYTEVDRLPGEYHDGVDAVVYRLQPTLQGPPT